MYHYGQLYARVDGNQQGRVARRLPGLVTRAFSTSTVLQYIIQYSYSIPLNLVLSSVISRLPVKRALSHLGMLALPLYPASLGPHQSPEGVPQYRPAKDIETFNKLLPPVVEFVEGSSSGTLLIAEGKYEPVNGSPKAAAASEVIFRHIILCCPIS